MHFFLYLAYPGVYPCLVFTTPMSVIYSSYGVLWGLYDVVFTPFFVEAIYPGLSNIYIIHCTSAGLIQHTTKHIDIHTQLFLDS